MLTKKDLQRAIGEAIADIINAVNKGLEPLATKEELRDGLNGVKEELRGELNGVKEELKGEIRDVKRQINDLKADTPTPQEFAGHEKRINKLEQSVFPS